MTAFPDLQGLATAVRYKGRETKGERGLYSSFDSANDFIVGYWRTIERNRLKHGWEAQLENASGSDSACRTFLETLSTSGGAARPWGPDSGAPQPVGGVLYILPSFCVFCAAQALSGSRSGSRSLFRRRGGSSHRGEGSEGHRALVVLGKKSRDTKTPSAGRPHSGAAAGRRRRAVGGGSCRWTARTCYVHAPLNTGFVSRLLWVRPSPLLSSEAVCPVIIIDLCRDHTSSAGDAFRYLSRGCFFPRLPLLPLLPFCSIYDQRNRLSITSANGHAIVGARRNLSPTYPPFGNCSLLSLRRMAL